MNQASGRGESQSSGIRRSRFCIVNENKPGVLGRITGLLGELNANIEQQVTKSRGEKAYEVLDVRCQDPTALRERISAVEGVLSCSLGHFTSDFATDAGECIIRLCIVHANIPGALGLITRKCASMNLNIISEVNRGKGSNAYTMLDLQLNQSRTNELVQKLISSISSMEVVISCDIDNFQPGSLYRRDTNESADQDELFLTSDSESVHFDTDSLRSDTGIQTRQVQLDEGEIEQEQEFTPTRVEKEEIRPAAQKGSYYQGAGEQVTPRSANFQLMQERSNLTRADKVVFAMVGLPCRGKSFIARKLERFLNWKTRRAKLFNAGKYRRESVETDHSRGELRLRVVMIVRL